MKKLLFLTIAGCLMAASIGIAGEVIVSNYNVDVDSNGVILVNKDLARKYLLVVNPDAGVTVYIATAPITGISTGTIGCIPLSSNFGSWEDNFFIYRSTWYATTVGTATTTVHIMEKE